MGKTSTAVKNRYNAKVYERIVMDVPKGTKAAYQELAKSRGKSLTQLVRELLEKELKKA